MPAKHGSIYQYAATKNVRHQCRPTVLQGFRLPPMARQRLADAAKPKTLLNTLFAMSRFRAVLVFRLPLGLPGGV